MRFKFLRHSKVIQQEPKPVIFFAIHNLMLSDFISIICDKELHRLIKQGSPSPKELADYWDSLFIKYCDLIGETDYEIAIDSEKELQVLAAKINLVSSAIKILMAGNVFVKDVVDFLYNEYGIVIEYFEDEASYNKQFIRIEGKIKKWQVDYDLLLLQNPKSEHNNQKSTREAFTRTRIVLGEFIGYPVKEHDTSVEEFAIMINKLNEHNTALEAQNKKAA